MLKPLDGRVGIRRDVVFGSTGSRELKCDVYLPPLDASGRPAVLVIHGGAWREGDRTQLQGYCLQLARRGIVAVACEYRLSAEAVWPAQREDVEAAYRWVASNADGLGVDPVKIAALGASAGGHLALLLAAELDRRHTPCPAAVVALYAPARLTPGAPDEAPSLLMGPDADASAFERASPLSRLSPGFPPTLLIHGDRDDLVPCRDSIDLYLRLQELRSDAELHVFSGAPHAFDLDKDYGRQCVQLIALFLERRVLRSSNGEG